MVSACAVGAIILGQKCVTHTDWGWHNTLCVTVVMSQLLGWDECIGEIIQTHIHTQTHILCVCIM